MLDLYLDTIRDLSKSNKGGASKGGLMFEREKDVEIVEEGDNGDIKFK